MLFRSAPAGIPAPILMKLNAAIVKMTKDPVAKEHASSQGAELTSMTPQEFTAYIKTQIARFAEVVKATGMRAD